LLGEAGTNHVAAVEMYLAYAVRALFKNILPRRANHGHNFIVRKFKSPRREIGRGLFVGRANSFRGAS